MTEVLRDIRHSSEKTEKHLASLDRRVDQLAEGHSQLRDELRVVRDELRGEMLGLRGDLQQTNRRLQQMSMRTVTFTFGGGVEASTPTQPPITPCPRPLPPRQLFDNSQPSQQQPSTPLASVGLQDTVESGQSLDTASEGPPPSLDGVSHSDAQHSVPCMSILIMSLSCSLFHACPDRVFILFFLPWFTFHPYPPSTALHCVPLQGDAAQRVPTVWSWRDIKDENSKVPPSDKFIHEPFPQQMSVGGLMDMWEGVPGSGKVPMYLMWAKWGNKTKMQMWKWWEAVKVLHLIIAISRQHNRINRAGAACVEAWFVDIYKGDGIEHKWTPFVTKHVAKLCDVACDKGPIPKKRDEVAAFHKRLYDEWTLAVGDFLLPNMEEYDMRGLPHEPCSLNHPTFYSDVIRSFV